MTYIYLHLTLLLLHTYTHTYQDPDTGFGLWFPNDSVAFPYRFSPLGALHVCVAVVGLSSYATCLAGAMLLATGLVYQV